MSRPERPLVATFDCYGTLVDWEGGAAGFLYQLALRSGDPAPPRAAELRERWERLQFDLIGGDYLPYRAVLAESLAAWGRESGYTVSDEDADAFARSMRSWGPFPDTRPALFQARAQGLRLVILSNSDHDIMEHTLRQLDLPFDDVVLAADAQAYKPDERPFLLALERIRDRFDAGPEQVVHVAFGFTYDIGPAQRLGMRTAWVNRHVEDAPGPERPDFEWRDLWGLARLVGGEGPGIE
jgi:2-haloacid dehalogenase